jgi:hypothetical protein
MNKHNALKFMANSVNEKQYYGDSFRSKKQRAMDASKGSQKFLTNVSIVIKPPEEEQEYE